MCVQVPYKQPNVAKFDVWKPQHWVGNQQGKGLREGLWTDSFSLQGPFQEIAPKMISYKIQQNPRCSPVCDGPTCMDSRSAATRKGPRLPELIPICQDSSVPPWEMLGMLLAQEHQSRPLWLAIAARGEKNCVVVIIENCWKQKDPNLISGIYFAGQ